MAEFFEVIAPVATQLGLSIVFIYMYVTERRYNKEKEEKVLEAFKEQSKTNQQLSGAIEKNTTATDKIFEVLLKNSK